MQLYGQVDALVFVYTRLPPGLSMSVKKQKTEKDSGPFTSDRPKSCQGWTQTECKKNYIHLVQLQFNRDLLMDPLKEP